MAWVSWIARQFEDFDLATAGPMALDSRSAQRLFQANLPTPTFRFKTWQGEALSPSFSDLLDHITIQHADHLLQNRSKPWLPNRDGTRPKCRRRSRIPSMKAEDATPVALVVSIGSPRFLRPVNGFHRGCRDA